MTPARMPDIKDPDQTQAFSLLVAIRPLLNKQKGEVVALVLGDLLATFAAQYIHEDEVDCADRPQSVKLQEQIFAAVVETAREYVQYYQDEFIEQVRGRGQ